MKASLFRAALTRIDPWEPFASSETSEEARTLLRGVAAVTGIAPGRLLLAERRMMSSGSLAPLRQLLADPELLREERLKFTIIVQQAQTMLTPTRSALISRILLDVETRRGRLVVQITMDLRVDPRGRIRSPHALGGLPASTQKLPATRLVFSYRIAREGFEESFQQSVYSSVTSNKRMPVRVI